MARKLTNEEHRDRAGRGGPCDLYREIRDYLEDRFERRGGGRYRLLRDDTHDVDLQPDATLIALRAGQPARVPDYMIPRKLRPGRGNPTGAAVLLHPDGRVEEVEGAEPLDLSGVPRALRRRMLRG